jgi:two-component system OmpR family sensor kinase
MKSPLSRVRTPLSLWSLRNRLILAAMVLTAVAISASDFAANAALRSYLISQVDKELIEISSGSLLRLDRAGIESEISDENSDSPFTEFRPLRGVPTSASVSLLDIDGKLIGRIGGDLSQKQIAVFGMSVDQVKAKGTAPFTCASASCQTRY